ncbi:hypothetical protein ABEW60_25900 [Paenibacillus jamilae]|uniref:hypothetical protein n=1 Tax=Paenibacillus jamilae TaxID=114136 RepID=UPI003D276F05
MQFLYKINIANLGIHDSDYREYLRDLYSSSLAPDNWTHKDIDFFYDGQRYQVSIDWKTAIIDIKDHVDKAMFIDEAFQLYEEAEGYSSLQEFLEDQVVNHKSKSSFSLIVETTENNEKKVDQVIFNLSQHIFLVANLSCPGIVDFYAATLTPNNEDLKLSKHTFEESLTESFYRGWPQMGSIPFNITFEWYNKLGVWSKDIAATSIEKALFAIMSYCAEEKLNPSRLIWIAHAIEALYETPHSGIVNSLRERIAIFLDIVEKKEFKKKLNDFYEYRSKFVHGGLPIAIPSIDFFDEAHGHYFNKLFEVERFGLAIIIATLQKLILSNWTKITFSTTYTGE